MTIRILFVADALAAAERILWAPEQNAVRISIDERVTLCALVLQQNEMIRRHGLEYPKPPAAGPSAGADR